MRKANTTTNSIKISERTRQLWEQRDKSLDNAEVPQLPPEVWAKGVIGKYYRPLKTQISMRIDNDVLDWLKSKGEGHLTRINEILREQMLHDREQLDTRAAQKIRSGKAQPLTEEMLEARLKPSQPIK